MERGYSLWARYYAFVGVENSLSVRDCGASSSGSFVQLRALCRSSRMIQDRSQMGCCGGDKAPDTCSTIKQATTTDFVIRVVAKDRENSRQISIKVCCFYSVLCRQIACVVLLCVVIELSTEIDTRTPKASTRVALDPSGCPAECWRSRYPVEKLPFRSPIPASQFFLACRFEARHHSAVQVQMHLSHCLYGCF